jgi:hypothetical protein
MRRKITYDPERDYYAVLGIDSDASFEEIRQAYRHTVREVHPDLHPDEADWATGQLQLINEAYDVLRRASSRRDYDRLRWLHLPSQPRVPRPTRRNPFDAPIYEPDRPWWEQAAAPDPNWTATRRRRAQRMAATPARPFWLEVSDWLKAHHMSALEPTWLTLVGIWRSPYAGLLGVLAVLLACNVALIIYAFITPLDRNPFGFFPSPGVTLMANSTTSTPDQLYQTCQASGVQIQTPARFATVPGAFSVRGTVKHPDMWSYTVAVGYLGPVFRQDTVPSGWTPVREMLSNQSIPEPPIEGDVLVRGVDLSEEPAGYYVLRVQVMLRNGSLLPPCDVIVHR